jgi:Zn-dependent protease
MTGDIYLGRLLGIPFRLHWSWFLAVFLIGWTLSVGFFPRSLPEHGTEAAFFWALGLTAAIGLFVSVLLHELGHALVAKLLRIPVRGIRLFVFGGVAELGSEPKTPWHELLVALSGPAVTVLLVVLFGLGLGGVLSLTEVKWGSTEGLLYLQGGSHATAGLAALLYYLAVINTVLLVFNLIPAFPLDGGRVLRSIVWWVTGSHLGSTRLAAAVGIGFAWLLFIGGFLMAFGGNLLGGVWFFFLGVFLQNAAQSSVSYVQLEHLLRGVRVHDMMCRQPVAVDAADHLQAVVDRFFLRHPYKAYPVVKDAQFAGMLALRAIQEIPREQWETTTVLEVISRRPAEPVLKPQEPVLAALKRLAETGQSRLPVVENGVLVGLLCGRDVMDYMEVRAGLASPRLEAAS